MTRVQPESTIDHTYKSRVNNPNYNCFIINLPVAPNLVKLVTLLKHEELLASLFKNKYMVCTHCKDLLRATHYLIQDTYCMDIELCSQREIRTFMIELK